MRNTSGDQSLNERFPDRKILNMIADAKVGSGEPIMKPVDDTELVVIRRMIAQSYLTSEESASGEEHDIILSVS